MWPLNSLPTIIPPLCAHHSSVYLICRWGWPGTRRWLPSAGLRAATVPDPVAWAGKWGRSIPVRGIHSHALGATELRPLLRARTGRRTRMSNRRRPLTSTPPADLSSFDVAPFSQHTIRIYRTAALVWSPTHTHTIREIHTFPTCFVFICIRMAGLATGLPPVLMVELMLSLQTTVTIWRMLRVALFIHGQRSIAHTIYLHGMDTPHTTSSTQDDDQSQHSLHIYIIIFPLQSIK